LDSASDTPFAAGAASRHAQFRGRNKRFLTHQRAAPANSDCKLHISKVKMAEADTGHSAGHSWRNIIPDCSFQIDRLGLGGLGELGGCLVGGTGQTGCRRGSIAWRAKSEARRATREMPERRNPLTSLTLRDRRNEQGGSAPATSVQWQVVLGGPVVECVWRLG
jgi:hypothetical protein